MIGDLLPWSRKTTSPAKKTEVSPVAELHSRMNNLFNSFFDENRFWPELGRNGKDSFMPCFEISETAKNIEITAEIPGVEEKDIDVSLDGGILTVKGEKKSEHDEKNKDYHITERSYGSFQRSFAMPEGIDSSKIDAKFKNGVLKISLPRTEESRKNVKKIKVSSE